MKKKQAISLIVLVITIIVMIVLAGAIILTLNNSGIIDKASEAVQKSDQATLQTIANVAWTERYAQNLTSVNKLEGDNLIQALEQAVKDALRTNGLKPEEYGVIATTNGVKIAKGWIQDREVVANGRYRLNVGDDFEYDETPDDDPNITVPKDVSWKVLGVSDSGELLIMSSKNIDDMYTVGIAAGRDEDMQEILAVSQDEWLNLEKSFDSSCAIYGKRKRCNKCKKCKA